jgi:hypothetical protein
MVNNSININKMNNHISSELTERTHKHVAGVKLVNGISTLHSWLIYVNIVLSNRDADDFELFT